VHIRLGALHWEQGRRDELEVEKSMGGAQW
jgi:hypothetical protein